MKSKRLPIIAIVVAILVILIIAVSSTNSYKSAEQNLWKGICNQDTKKIITMCPNDFFEQVSTGWKSSEEYITQKLERNLKDYPKDFDWYDFEYSDLTFEYEVLEKGDIPKDVSDKLERFASFVDYEIEPSQCVKVDVSIPDSKTHAINYCIKIGSKWYSLSAMGLVYNSAL